MVCLDIPDDSIKLQPVPSFRRIHRNLLAFKEEDVSLGESTYRRLGLKIKASFTGEIRVLIKP